jgi:phosphoribosylformylglycinamidine synthase
MAMAGATGAQLTVASPAGLAPHAFWFGEDQARYVAAVTDGAAFCRAAQLAGVPALPLGRSGGEALVLPGGETISVARLSAAHEATLPALMA